jgi:hypothetical protein
MRAGRHVMWQHNEIEKSAEGGPNNWEQPWPCTETLKTLAEVNEQCLELLTEQALLHTSPAPPMFRELAYLWGQLDMSARRTCCASRAA